MVTSGITRPPFFCVGAQKAGTTTLHAALASQSAFRLPATKETKFFVDPALWQKGVDWYLAEHFRPVASPDDITGEVDPDCLFVPESAGRIATSFPDARIVVLLRDPVDRAFSHYLMTVRRGLETLPFGEALDAEAERMRSPDRRVRGRFSYTARGAYADQLRHYMTMFPADRIHIELFEDLVGSAIPTLSRIQTFIGGPPPPADLTLPRENVQAGVRFPGLARLLDAQWPGRAALRAATGTVLRPLIGRIRRRNTAAFRAKPVMDAEQRRRLVAHFRPGVEDLSELIGRDLRHWLQDTPRSSSNVRS